MTSLLAEERRIGLAERGRVKSERHKRLGHLFDNLKSSSHVFQLNLVRLAAAACSAIFLASIASDASC